MNVYDTANRLAEELKQSEEYSNYKIAKETLNINHDLKNKIKEFEEARYDAQITAMQTGKNDEEKVKKMQSDWIGRTIVKDLSVAQQEMVIIAKKYFEAEMKFNILLADVNKIIGDAVKDVIQ